MSRKYWEQRSAWDMYQFMEDAEETADLIARVYRKASLQLEYAARDIFEKFMTKYGLSETEAWQIINSIQDKNSIDQLKQELQNRKKDSEILKQLEAAGIPAGEAVRYQTSGTAWRKSLLSFHLQHAERNRSGIQLLSCEQETNRPGSADEMVRKTFFRPYLEEHTAACRFLEG